MQVDMKDSSSFLYLKAHLFRSTESALRLAEKREHKKDIKFALMLLEAKISHTNKRLYAPITPNNGKELCKAEKYGRLISAAEELDSVSYFPPSKTQTQFDNLNDYADQLNSEGHFVNVPGVERYKDVLTAKSTQITTSTGVEMPANHVSAAGNLLAIRCQYPKRECLHDHFQMILDQKPPVLVVLSSTEDIRDGKPPYFKENKQYDDISTVCTRKYIDKTKPDQYIPKINELTLEYYNMQISAGQQPNGRIDVPVIHVTNWPDRKPVKPETLKKLVETIKYQISVNQTNRSVPLIHCNAGVGRTGMVMAAMALTDPQNEQRVDDVIMDIRKTGAPYMVQTLPQYENLLALKKFIKTPCFLRFLRR